MRYFTIGYNYHKSDEFVFLHFDESELPFGCYDVYIAKELPCKTIYCTIEHGTIMSDYLANNLSLLVISEKIRAVFAEFELCSCQFVEVRDKESKTLLGYLVNCLEHYKALDEKNSVCQRFPNEKIRPLIVIRHAILEENVHGKDLFQLKEDVMAYFISERLKRALVKSKSTRFTFLPTLSPQKENTESR